MRHGMVVACAALTCVSFAAPAQGQFSLGFEDLTADPPGSPYTYVFGDSFVTSGTTVNVDQFFFFPSGTPTTTGPGTEADNTLIPTSILNYAGRSGNAMGINNVSLDFLFPSGTTFIDFWFGEYGGNVNMTVNGSLFNAADFATLPATLGGASISYLPVGPTPDGTGILGQIAITGAITQFSVGGQELWIDDFRVIPTPGTASLLVLGSLIAIRRRR